MLRCILYVYGFSRFDGVEPLMNAFSAPTLHPFMLYYIFFFGLQVFNWVFFFFVYAPGRNLSVIFSFICILSVFCIRVILPLWNEFGMASSLSILGKNFRSMLILSLKISYKSVVRLPYSWLFFVEKLNLVFHLEPVYTV